MNVQAREAFNAYFHTGTSKCWDFLKRFYHPKPCPDHLTVAVEAVSLAYLWHQVYSDAALLAARKQYILALSMLKKILRSSVKAIEETTLLSSLLLDLFEKMTDSRSRTSKFCTSHVMGGLALVKLRGLEQYKDPYELRVLRFFSGQCLFSCVVSGTPVPDDLVAIRTYIGRESKQDVMCQMANVFIRYARLRSDARAGILRSDGHVREAKDLDANLHVLDLDVPPCWQYSTSSLEQDSDRAFGLRYDVYPHRNICHARNIIRIVRILLNESLIEHYLASPSAEGYSLLLKASRETISTLALEICACAPQYIDCTGAASSHAQNSNTPCPSHPHTPNHQADVYSIIFPLYVAGRCNGLPEVRAWIIQQLRYMGNHFHIRNAMIVAQVLETEARRERDPWEMFALLGSYAFTV